jgi:hypothetical protein
MDNRQQLTREFNMTFNIAYLEIDNVYQDDPKPYKINYISYQESPYDNIPEGFTTVAWDDITFSVKKGGEYDWNSVENAVVNGEGTPIYLIGDFYKV